MQYQKLKKKDFENWLEMTLTLWPDHKKEDLKKELQDIIKSKKEETFIAKDDSKYVGFINISLRYEYIEGSKTSPVGYVEGIYIEPKYRKKGIASELLKHGEKWAKQKGAQEMASDTGLKNKISQNFHKKLDFKVADTIVHFIKKIE